MISPQPHKYYDKSPNIFVPPSKFVNCYSIDYSCLLGKGNFSEVYKCCHIQHPRDIFAVKLMNIASLKQKKAEKIIHTEIDMLKRVNHKNVVKYKDVFWTEHWCYIITELYPRGNLQKFINRDANIPESPQILSIIKEIFQGMLYLEKINIIHRDIKPANIFLKENGAVIADFGFAKYLNQGFYDAQIGSLPYMAPETLIRGYYSCKTDVWAFGVLLYEIFHGEGPFVNCRNLITLIQKVSVPISLDRIRLNLSMQMKQLILNCLQISLQKRPKFIEIKNSWYFKRLFQNEHPTIRNPLQIIDTFQRNQVYNVKEQRYSKKNLKQREQVFRNPSIQFNKLKKLKHNIRKMKEENGNLLSKPLLFELDLENCKQRQKQKQEREERRQRQGKEEQKLYCIKNNKNYESKIRNYEKQRKNNRIKTEEKDEEKNFKYTSLSGSRYFSPKYQKMNKFVFSNGRQNSESKPKDGLSKFNLPSNLNLLKQSEILKEYYESSCLKLKTNNNLRLNQRSKDKVTSRQRYYRQRQVQRQVHVVNV